MAAWGAIISSLGIVGYWLKPLIGVRGNLPAEALETLGRRAIDQKLAIHLIRCGGKVLVVGVSPEGARTLSEITDPMEVQRLVAVCRTPRELQMYPLGPGVSSVVPGRPTQRPAVPA